jgi:uncharacterized membrane protein YgcG
MKTLISKYWLVLMALVSVTLFTACSTDDADKLIELIKEHLVGASRNSDKLLNLLQTYKDALNKDLEKLNGEGGASSSSGSYGGGSDEGGGEGGEGGGGEDFGLDIGSDTDLTL